MRFSTKRLELKIDIEQKTKDQFLMGGESFVPATAPFNAGSAYYKHNYGNVKNDANDDDGGTSVEFAANEFFTHPFLGSEKELTDLILRKTHKREPIEFARFIDLSDLMGSDGKPGKDLESKVKDLYAKLEEHFSAKSRYERVLAAYKSKRKRKIIKDGRYKCKHCKLAGLAHIVIQNDRCLSCKALVLPPPKTFPKEVRQAEREANRLWKRVEKILSKIEKIHNKEWMKKQRQFIRAQMKSEFFPDKKSKNDAIKGKLKLLKIPKLAFGTVAAGWTAY